MSVHNTDIKESQLFNMSNGTRKLTPFDKGIKLVAKASDLDPWDCDPGVLRAVLSCGHITDAETLADYCKTQLEDGKTEFTCPVELYDDGCPVSLCDHRCPVSVCKKKWPYEEVRKLAKLTLDEQQSFEEKLGMNTFKKIVDFRECPGCSSFIEREDLSNLCVRCAVCTEKNGKTFEFCWQCMRVWKGPVHQTDQCGNVGCRNAEDKLRNCPMIILTYFEESTVQCPKIRKCPSCGVLIEHDSIGCNCMECLECHQTFCFICLQPNHYYNEQCPCTLAPRQINSEF